MPDPMDSGKPPEDAEPPVADDQALEAAEPAPTGVLGLFNRHMRYPNAYTWLLLFSAMDVMLTWTIFHFGGSELNPIAKWVIAEWWLNGMIVYKFALILFFIMICEIVGSLREPTGRVLSRISVMIALVPIVWSLSLLARYAFG